MTNNSVDDAAWFVESAKRLSWREARVKNHAYIVKGSTVSRAVYERMFAIIVRDGENRRWWDGGVYRYYRPGDGYMYWVMSFDPSVSKIMNRAYDDGGDSAVHREDL